MKDKTTIGFYGGASTVTGSNFLLEHKGFSFIVDCGLFQGAEFADDDNYAPFPYDPASLDAVVITHGHLDHIGRLPRLVREGYSGPIYGTPPTRDLAELLFEDGLSIMEENEVSDREPLYTREDVQRTLALWKPVDYRQDVSLSDAITFSLKDAGHIIGSAMVDVEINGEHVVFTGDVGNSPSPILAETEALENASYVVMESVYGDKKHETPELRREKLEEVIEHTVRENGVLLIPAFSIDRTQTLLAELNYLIERGKVPQIPVFLDSPLGIRVTEVYKKHAEYFNKRAQALIAKGDELFEFPNLKFTETVDESKNIFGVRSPKIIIAGSGMSNGGRILHHEKRYLSDPSTTILFVGFQTAGSLGRKILDGAKSVEIFGETIPVRVKARTIFSYSAHKDAEGLLMLVQTASKSLRKVFVTMGEQKSSMFLAQRIRDFLGISAVVPKPEQVISLDL